MEYVIVSIVGFIVFSATFGSFFFLCYDALIDLLPKIHNMLLRKFANYVFIAMSVITAIAFATIHLQAALKFCEDVKEDYGPDSKTIFIFLLALFPVGCLFYEYIEHMTWLKIHVGAGFVYAIAAITVLAALLLAVYRSKNFIDSYQSKQLSENKPVIFYFLFVSIGLASFVFSWPIYIGIASLSLAFISAVTALSKEKHRWQKFVVLCLAIHTLSEGMFAAKGAANIGYGMLVVFVVLCVKAALEFMIDFVEHKEEGHTHNSQSIFTWSNFFGAVAAFTIGFTGGLEAHVMFGLSIIMAVVFATATTIAEHSFIDGLITDKNTSSVSVDNSHSVHTHGLESKYWRDFTSQLSLG